MIRYCRDCGARVLPGLAHDRHDEAGLRAMKANPLLSLLIDAEGGLDPKAPVILGPGLERCERCGEELNPKQVHLLELDQGSGLYHLPGTLPEGATSQGCFPFGLACRGSVLANGGRLERIRRAR